MKLIERLLARIAALFRGGKVKDFLTRKTSEASRGLFRTLFSRGGLRALSLGGAFIGMGLVLIISYLIDKMRASALRSYSFVNKNFDFAGRSWKRFHEREEQILREHYWPVYALALEAHDVQPPFWDETSFMERATRALDEDRTLLEGENAHGERTRIPFREPQKLFNTTPLSYAKNSINDLRFSNYRDLRDSHLGNKRFLVGLTQSSPFENYMLSGLRREILTMIARGMRKADTLVRLEDILGTADPACTPPEVARERDQIRAYTARKVLSKRHTSKERTFRVLEDGLTNAMKEVAASDPLYLCGDSTRIGAAGGFALMPGKTCVIDQVAAIIERFCPPDYRPDLNLEKLRARQEEVHARSLDLVEFLREHDPERKIVRDVGDFRAVRTALAMDKRLCKSFDRRERPAELQWLLERFGEIAGNQAAYDRALVELRSVCQGVIADFGLYADFLEQNFERFAGLELEKDYDPLSAKILPTIAQKWRRFLNWLRQKFEFR